MSRVDQAAAAAAVAALLRAIGEDPDREGLRETPARVARLYAELLDAERGARLDTGFASHDTDQLVVVSGMRVWSLCEHHLLPFSCDVSAAYLAQGRVLGLSKFARIARRCAGALQVQERLVEQIADEICAALDHTDVAVLARGEHLCMTMRGVRTPARVTSSALRGVFREEAGIRAEFLSLARG